MIGTVCHYSEPCHSSLSPPENFLGKCEVMYIEYNTRVKSLIDNQILKMIFNIWLSIKDFTGIQTLVMSFQCVQILSIIKTMPVSIISLHIHVSSFRKNKKNLK